MDAFFASVEEARHPAWKGKPIIVGGSATRGENRAVVSTCSYAARKYGVHSAMPLSVAHKLCPSGIFVPVDFAKYSQVSSSVMAILKEYSPVVVQRSIDEAYLDTKGTERLFGAPADVVAAIRKKVSDVAGVTFSAGIASNPYIAKIASGINKPAGLCVVAAGKEEDFMLALPLEKLWGVGKATLERLGKAGIHTTSEIYSKQLEYLILVFGKSMGTFLYNSVRGIDATGGDAMRKTHSISSEKTFLQDFTRIEECLSPLLELCQDTMFRLIYENGTSSTVMIKIKYADFSVVNVQQKSSTFITSVDDLFSRASMLFKSKVIISKGVRLLGVALCDIQNGTSAPLTLFDEDNKRQKATETVAKINKQYNKDILKKSGVLDG